MFSYILSPPYTSLWPLMLTPANSSSEKVCHCVAMSVQVSRQWPSNPEKQLNIPLLDFNVSSISTTPSTNHFCCYIHNDPDSRLQGLPSQYASGQNGLRSHRILSVLSPKCHCSLPLGTPWHSHNFLMCFSSGKSNTIEGERQRVRGWLTNGNLPFQRC